MALRKEYFDKYDHNKDNKAMKRVRITFDVDHQLRKRIKVAAAKNNQSISEYLGHLLEELIPSETELEEQARHPLPSDFMEGIYKVREQVIRESKGHLFEDSAEALRRLREERTHYLEQLRGQE